MGHNFTEENKYIICCARLVGLKLPPRTFIPLEKSFISNDLEYMIASKSIDSEEFIKAFGLIDYSMLQSGDYAYLFTFFIAETEDRFNMMVIKDQLFTTDFITESWRIRDNSIYIEERFYWHRNGKVAFYRDRLGDSISDSKGNSEDAEFSQSEIESFESLRVEGSKFLLDRGERFTQTKNGTSTYITSDAEYNEFRRVHRALSFKFDARTTDILPKKITNYIVFLEGLFSTSDNYVKKNVSERVAIFLNKENGTDKDIIRDLIRVGYKVRSECIHGAELGKNKTYEELKIISFDIDEICRKVANNILSKKMTQFDGSKKDLQIYLDSLGVY